jgi:chaperonin GroEL
MIEGVLPGGGMSLLACRPMLQYRLAQAHNPDERAAYHILLKAVEVPLRVLAANSGYEPSEILAKLSQAGPHDGFDLRTGQIVNMRQAGIFDPARAQKTAIHSAITGAALALTTDVLVQHKNPKPPAGHGPGDNWSRVSTKPY